MDGEQSPKKLDGGGVDTDGGPLDYAEVFSSLSYWYHLPYSEIRKMPHSAIEKYMAQLQKHRATTRLMLGEAAKVPFMSDDDRRAWAREIESVLDDGRKETKVAPLAVLKMVGIGVRGRKA